MSNIDPNYPPSQNPNQAHNWQQRTWYQAPPLPMPPITATVVLTVLFGVFGAFSANNKTKSVERTHGVRVKKYWHAFWLTFAISVAVWLVVIIAAGSGTNNTSHGANRAQIGGYAAPDTPSYTLPTLIGTDADSAFETALSLLGINEPASVGQDACLDLDLNSGDLVGAASDLSNSTDLGIYQAGEVLGAAIGAYCPQYASSVGQ